MVSWIKTAWSKVKSVWASFEAWVASWAPGFKTKLVTVIGVVGTAAANLQEYVSGIPLTKFVTETQLAIVTMVLFTLAFWFRGIGARVASRTS